MELELNNISVDNLKNINLKIKENELTAIIGAFDGQNKNLIDLLIGNKSINSGSLLYLEKERNSKLDAMKPAHIRNEQVGGSEDNIKRLNLIIKANTFGSAEAVSQAIAQLESKEIITKIIHVGVGDISEADVMLASASNAIILGFTVKEDSNALAAAENLAANGIDVSVLRLTRLTNIDFDALRGAVKDIPYVIFLEEACAGIRDAVACGLGSAHRVEAIDLRGEFVTHGNIEKLYEKYCMDAKSIELKVKEVLGK